MALGGVATGIMNARDDDMATAAIIPNGEIPRVTAMDAAIGIRIVAVAVFDVISVNILVMATVTRINRNTGIPTKNAKLWDTYSARPVSANARAIANPPH
jgi:hypothetical protein